MTDNTAKPFEDSLRHYMRQHQIQATHLSFDVPCHSVAEAAAAVRAAHTDFVKNICMIGEDGRLIVAIVKGEDRASSKRVGQALGIAPPRLAAPDEIEALSGYPCGGTPSFGYSAVFLVDPLVLENEVVYTGGGSETSLVRIAPQELLRGNGGRVARVRK